MKLKNVKVKYRYGATACAALNFNLKRGENLAVVGDTASGKSTLLKLIAGLTENCEGSFIIDGKNADTVSIKDRDTVFVQDRIALFNFRSVRFNLAYPLIIRGESKNETDAKVAYALSKVGLDVNPKKAVCRLTEDEKIKLCYARIFIRPASVYLIDDLYKELDGNAREELLDIICNFARDENKTVVLATESIEEAKRFGNRILLLSYGVQTAEGDISDISDNIPSVWVLKTLFPNTAIFQAKIERKDGKTELVSESANYPIDESLLLDGVFIEKPVLYAECSGKLYLFDKISENLIYPVKL